MKKFITSDECSYLAKANELTKCKRSILELEDYLKANNLNYPALAVAFAKRFLQETYETIRKSNTHRKS